MPDSLTTAGLVVKTLTEILSDLTTAMQTIYGADINVDSNSPDGQLLGIFAQAAEDVRELIVDVYAGFGVEGAYGTVLDQRVAINGIARRQGTFTVQNVLVTVNQALTLYGLDQTAQPVFTVSDGAGNQFQLQVTHIFGGSGSATLAFQAAQIGQVETTPNTITNQVTTVLGVSSVNNPAAATSIGVNEETDAQLKVRHAKSFALAATGPADSVQAALTAIPDVLDAYVVENTADTTVNTVPAHSIWAIVTGGTDAEIAQAIYAKKGLGCGMKGSKSHVISRPNGTSFTALWDASIAESLWIKATINPITPGQSFDTTLLTNELAATLSFKLAQSPNVGNVVQALAVLAPTGYLTNIGVSTDGISYFDVVSPSDAQHYFSTAADKITISL